MRSNRTVYLTSESPAPPLASPTPLVHDDRSSVDSVLAAVRRHEDYRRRCIGLVPTENRLSPLARGVLQGDLSHRYLFQNPQWRYVGGAHLAEVEEAAMELARRAFGARYANVRALSGENCTNIVIHALTRPGDVFYHLAMEDGGHFAAASVAERVGAERHLLPYDSTRAVLDLRACAAAFERHPPDVIYLDASMMLYRHPVRELRALAGPDALIVYDASQVFGLIAGGVFGDPLREGADILSGSTHKSLPGPQKGMILSDRSDLMARVEATIFPGFVSNFHLHHVAALAVTLAETLDHGVAYARQTVANARALGHALRKQGFRVEGGAGVTDSHQVWVDVRELGTPDQAVERLHAANLIANVNLIPSIRAKGLRLGVPEVTRLGYREEEMREVARLMHRVLIARAEPELVRERVVALAERFTTPRYCHPGTDPA
jgi:glycine hydroxymethyltransferase